MRHRYIVAYDICEPKRLRKVHKKMQGYGTRLQYSVFFCRLSRSERIGLEASLADLINQAEDRVLIACLGPDEGPEFDQIGFIGPIPWFDRPGAVII